MRVVDVMTPLPDVVQQDDPVWRAADVMRDHDVGIVPVVRDHNSMRLIGVITDRDRNRFPGRHPSALLRGS